MSKVVYLTPFKYQPHDNQGEKKQEKKMKNPFALLSFTRKISAPPQKAQDQPLIPDLENPKTIFLKDIKPAFLPHLSQQPFF
jgi:hypothetical protein